MWDERAKAAIDRSRNGSTGSAIMAQLLAAANTQTSDTAVWGRSPDISEWRDVVLESTEVAPDGQRLPYVQMNNTPVRRDRDRLYIAFETQSDQFPPWLSSLFPRPL